MVAAPVLQSGRYAVQNRVGAGGMGVVYRCLDRLTGQTIALKSVNLERVTGQRGDDLQVALTREFELLASLHHPHIVEVLDYGFDGSQQPYFTMSFIEGGKPLDEAAQALPFDEKVRLLIETLEALAYLHRRGIIHHDVKPSNVLVDPHGQVKVLDFGAAMLRERQSKSYTKGTLAYMAPEVLQGKRATEASDLYAVGLLAYQLFVGRHPFDLENMRVLLNQIVNEVPDLSALPDPPLREVIAKLLVKAPDQRYQSAHAVIQQVYTALGQPIPQEHVGIRESFLQAARFTGRQAELSQMTTGLDRALSGETAAYLIGGESGVGKSRLVDEFRIAALVKGASVLRSQGAEGGGLRYQLWRDVLPTLILSTPISDFEAGVLMEIVPPIAGLLGRDIAPVPPLLGPAQHQRLSQTIADLFQRLTRPTVLLLEDLQWTSESLDILIDLLQSVKQSPLVIVGTYRDDEAPRLPERLPAMHLITLKRLQPQEIAELSAAMIGDAGRQPHVLDFVINQTEGNPFFLVEVMRALAHDTGRLLTIGSKTLPEQVFTGGIQQIVQQRILQVPAWGQSILQIAAAAGRQLDLAVLEQIRSAHGGLLAETLENWLTACADVHVLISADNRWQFSHDKIREQILRDFPPDQLPLAHAQVASAIETCYPNDSARVEVLMLHWRQAGIVEKELTYLNLAVERLVWNRGDYQGAQTLIERGLSIVRANDPRRATLLNHLTESYWRMGMFGDAQKHGQKAIRVSRRIAALLEEARAWGNLGITARMSGDEATARRYIIRSLKIRRAQGDKLGTARSYANLGIVEFQRSNYEKARRYYRRALKLQREIGDQYGYLLSLSNLGEILGIEKQYEQARKVVLHCLKLARKLGIRYTIAVTQNTLGVLAFLTQDYPSAIRYIGESNVIFRALRDRYGVLYSLSYLVQILPPDHADLRTFVEEAIRLGRDVNREAFLIQALIGGVRWYAIQHEDDKAAQLMGLLMRLKGYQDNVAAHQFIELIVQNFPALASLSAVSADGSADDAAAQLPSAIDAVLLDLESAHPDAIP